jgi:hypothetical protein
MARSPALCSTYYSKRYRSKQRWLAPVGRLAGEDFAKKAAAKAITFPLTAAPQLPTQPPSADLSEQLAGA